MRATMIKIIINHFPIFQATHPSNDRTTAAIIRIIPRVSSQLAMFEVLYQGSNKIVPVIFER